MTRRKSKTDGWREGVIEQRTLGGYHLPDHAIDLEVWLRDGLEVYNLFVLMKPLFFQMLDALGGEFEAPYSKINVDGKGWRVTMGERVPDGGDSITDRVIFARLSAATGKTERFVDSPARVREGEPA